LGDDRIQIFQKRKTMRRTIHPLFVALLISLLPLAGLSDRCPLPEPFDVHAVYTRTVYASPAGSDANGDGSESRPFRTLSRAAQNAQPGTRMRTGEYPPGTFLTNLRGTAESPIMISGVPGEEPPVFKGGSEGLHLVDPRYVVLQNLHVTGASGNGINIDDGGSYDTPAEYVILRNLTVTDIGPSGNHDGIKLSGLDRFRVEYCTIVNPGDGGSAIDMVGCHDGILAFNQVGPCANSGIQAKGGSSRLLIFANRFTKAGLRAINAGGSTGMPFFRPLDAPFEAAELTIWANTFTGSQAPVAFVGSEKCLFAHNTIFQPEKWVIRILQENLDAQLIRCRDNVFADNIVIVDGQVSPFVNIGPNTHPETFVFACNLWYHLTALSFRGPDLPARETEGVIQKDPQLIDPGQGDFHPRSGSPALGAGMDLTEILKPLGLSVPPVGDGNENCWNAPPALGAYDLPATAAVKEDWP